MPYTENNGGMWDGLPPDWEQDPKSPSAVSGEQKRQEEPSVSSTEREQPAEARRAQQQPVRKTEKSSFQEKREQRKRLREFEKKSEENRLQGAEHVQKAYQKERDGNRRDFIALAVASGFVVLGIVIFVFLFTGTGQQRVYDLIEDGHYATAYQAIAESHESGKNVDSQIYAFVDSCVGHNEYKRAVAALEFLSEEAGSETDFFTRLVESLREKGKEKRAEEVLRFMDGRGGALAQEAERLRVELSIG